MRSFITFITLIVIFEYAASQDIWFPNDLGFRQNFQQTTNRYYRPVQQNIQHQASNFFFPQQPARHSRVSDRKCEEYLKLSKRIVPTGSLSIRPTIHNVVVDDCKGSQGLIINGENAKDGEYPHMAAIAYVNRSQVVRFICGGTLISDQFILTSAHCKFFEGIPSSIVRLGALNLNATVQGSYQDIGIQSFISHEKYKSSRMKNDIAVIKLVSKVTFSKFVRPACLMTPSKHVNIQKAVVTGWGMTQPYIDKGSDILQKAELNIQHIDRCREYMEDETLDNTQICAGHETKDTCGGDSGGPLQIASPANKCVQIIAGVTSYGISLCGGENSVAIYTNVESYVDWIEQKVWGINS
ncbi:serine protease snake-like [Chironomus tepperi]|uniref:serine protease snake-like n=1 Tax=Chironomus tepperi TaxID=113505 RepID=UPI00391FC260